MAQVLGGRTLALTAAGRTALSTWNMSQVPNNRMQLRGAIWEIQFGQETGQFPAGDYSALHQVSQLLIHPGNAILYTDLLPEQGCFEVPSSKPDYVFDRKTFQDARNALLDALEVGNEELAAELESQLSAAAVGMRRKELGRTSGGRAWDAQTKRIRRLCPRLTDNQMPEFGEHLRLHLHFNCPTITYSPPAATAPWEVHT